MSDDVVTRRGTSEPSWTGYGGDAGVSDCYGLVRQLALDSGLSAAEAADVCQVTFLRLADHDPAFEHLTPPMAEWVLRLAREQCVVARQLRTWRHAGGSSSLSDLVPA